MYACLQPRSNEIPMGSFCQNYGNPSESSTLHAVGGLACIKSIGLDL